MASGAAAWPMIMPRRYARPFLRVMSFHFVKWRFLIGYAPLSLPWQIEGTMQIFVDSRGMVVVMGHRQGEAKPNRVGGLANADTSALFVAQV